MANPRNGFKIILGNASSLHFLSVVGWLWQSAGCPPSRSLTLVLHRNGRDRKMGKTKLTKKKKPLRVKIRTREIAYRGVLGNGSLRSVPPSSSLLPLSPHTVRFPAWAPLHRQQLPQDKSTLHTHEEMCEGHSAEGLVAPSGNILLLFLCFHPVSLPSCSLIWPCQANRVAFPRTVWKCLVNSSLWALPFPLVAFIIIRLPKSSFWYT